MTVEGVTVSRNSDREQVQEILDELGADVDLEEDIRSGVEGLDEFDDSELAGVDVSSTEVSIVKEYDPEVSSESPGDYTREFLLDSGSRVTVTIKKRPECPNCGYIPLQDDEPVSLTGECTECGTRVCPSCRNNCAACGTILCSGCTMGHGSVNETYCPICRQDVQDEVEHERELDKREQRRLERQDRVEQELNIRSQSHSEEMDRVDRALEERENRRSHELSKENKELERRRQEHSERMDKLEHQLDEWKRKREDERKSLDAEHDRAMEMFEAQLKEWRTKKEMERQLDQDSHQEDMDKLDKMVKLAEMINSAEDTEGIRDRLTAADRDPFPEMGNQFSGMDLGDGSNTDDEEGYSYDEVFE
ncbi:hypothetical protein [Haloarcula marismortui]|uniref:Uncharacterized protein n=1 Tax=Haloarcula marismortui ATCC 33800 TaxID=662476 RepID=A0A8T8KAH6_9EURY|nr:hypothetical protein [Haloarcula sinaiiensis]QUJ71936.1 hypothetical protein KDQ40_14780 [Haloarcula sinaiiensis ATCC 33800]